MNRLERAWHVARAIAAVNESRRARLTTTKMEGTIVVMTNTPHVHTHTTDCLAGNELNELCCIHLPTDQLSRSHRHTVEVVIPNLTFDVHTFTDTDDDALALVRASLAHALPDVEVIRLRVTFRDTSNSLDLYA